MDAVARAYYHLAQLKGKGLIIIFNFYSSVRGLLVSVLTH